MSRIEERVIQKIRTRAETGYKKYGVTMERTDLSFEEWVAHLQEELMDAAIYAERLLSSTWTDSDESLPEVKYFPGFGTGESEFVIVRHGERVVLAKLIESGGRAHWDAVYETLSLKSTQWKRI